MAMFKRSALAILFKGWVTRFRLIEVVSQRMGVTRARAKVIKVKFEDD